MGLWSQYDYPTKEAGEAPEVDLELVSCHQFHFILNFLLWELCNMRIIYPGDAWARNIFVMMM